MNQHQRVIKRLALMLTRCSVQLAVNFFNITYLPYYLQLVANLATLTSVPFGQQSTRKERVIKAPLCASFESFNNISDGHFCDGRRW